MSDGNGRGELGEENIETVRGDAGKTTRYPKMNLPLRQNNLNSPNRVLYRIQPFHQRLPLKIAKKSLWGGFAFTFDSFLPRVAFWGKAE